MNNKELQALRKLLMLDVKEAAEYVGGVSSRTWQYWETGRYPIPQDVESEIKDFINLRSRLLKQRISEFQNGDLRVIQYYMTIDEFEQATGKRNIIMWRITNSVAAEISAKNYIVRVV
ncbi:Aca2/YdiL-like domain-containing protein [Photorhabdus viridis]|uniref:Aca2/YdiL-like domain-containing protein n=1 Tax=Photorhabdus viridis TaxID=3163327 RepID=UPI003307772A